MKYWAFLSYSHRDAAAAARLQRALETYRIPQRLVGASTPSGAVPARLSPVFRDREEMQAGSDLAASVREAILQSRCLVVICSPDAARSPWVNREIIEFKRLHGEGRVFAVIVAGEPFASAMPGRESDECFPEALRFALDDDGLARGAPLEPVAADLRTHGDGERLGLLKLVAGIIGVGVDSLARRDAQRRARRMAVVTIASLCGMGVMAVLTVSAVKSRNEAQSQRAQAEDLIEFMLVDLRKRLNPVGKLDLLDSLGEKALAYYNQQDAERLDAGSLGRRSRAMHLVGEIREQRGQLDDALAAFNHAAATTAALLERAPDDGKRVFDHAQSVYWIGYIAWRRGQAEAANTAFVRYRELAQRLVRLDPDNVDWQLETVYAGQNLGVVQLDRGQTSEALRSFTDARDVLARLAPARPALVPEAAGNQGWRAKALEASNDYEGAIAAQHERLTLLRSVPDAGKDRQIQQQIANANHELGRLALALGRLDEAQSSAQMAVDIAGALVASDPANMFWLSEASFNRLGLAEVEDALGRRAAALAEVAQALPQIARLVASDDSATNWQIKLQGRALALSAEWTPEGRRPPVDDLARFLVTVKRFEAEGTRLSADQAVVVAAVELALGDLLEHGGARDAALVQWRAAAERIRKFAERDNFPSLTALSRIKLRLGDAAEANAMFL
ncbi:MAG: toll/interleukin-1 receptor domain-containing protein, partial [Casimicrobiaceae bacterium]